MALYTWGFEQRRLLAISSMEGNSLFSFMVFCASNGLSLGNRKILHPYMKRFRAYRVMEMPFGDSSPERHGCLSERFVLKRLREHLGSTLRRIARERDFDVTVSEQKLNKVELIELVRQQREDAAQDLVYSARPFIVCGLPVRRPPAGTLIHRRRNGHFFLHIQGHPDFGLPFGQDRLVAIWVASLAVRQRSRVIEFETASEILEEFGMPRNGVQYRRLVDGFKRIFASTIFFGMRIRPPGKSSSIALDFLFLIGCASGIPAKIMIRSSIEMAIE